MNDDEIVAGERSLKGWFMAALLLVGAMAVAGLWAWLQLPPGARVPIHFNARGEADGWSGPAFGLSFMPMVACGTLLLTWVLPQIDPRGKNLKRSGGAYGLIQFAVVGLFCVLQAVIVGAALGHPMQVVTLLDIALGVMLMAMGNVMGKLRWNMMVGVRTPWTIADERVWDQTHRFAGKIFVLGGLLLVAAAFAPLPPPWQPALIAVVPASVAVAAMLKSYWLWRSRQQASH
jgi:uncharacterized membrane protein